VIRPARLADVEPLRMLEVVAGARFREVGLAAVAAADPPHPARLVERIRRGQAWVAVDSQDEPIGFVLVHEVDGNAHVEQVSVLPDHGRRGLGSALVGRVADWAAKRGLPAITLTTFVDVPWNAPWYRRLGFEVVPATEPGPGLRRICAEEEAVGLPADRRVVMRRRIGE
jgi:GNAT superfamily N-acetyltransferase